MVSAAHTVDPVAADDGVADLVALLARAPRTCVVGWTPELRAIADASPITTAWLGPLDAPTPVRVLAADERPVRLPASVPGGGKCRIHRRVLCLVTGEPEPRWIDASRLEEPCSRE